MHLKVKCPNGCVVRMPTSQAGKTVQCPQCRATIRIGDIVRPDEPPPLPQSTRRGQPFATGTDSQPAKDFQSSVEHLVIAIRTDHEKPLSNGGSEMSLLAARMSRSRNDRVTMSRGLAILVATVGIVHVFPFIYHACWVGIETGEALPKWMYLQFFVAALHCIYALFLWQVSDWSALWGVSVASLVIAALFGFLSSALLIGGPQSQLVMFLGLGYTLHGSATIWTLAMLILATICSLLLAREAFHWQRIESIYKKLNVGSPEV
jgi:hypothetical protein